MAETWRWQWTLAARPQSSCQTQVEWVAVRAFRDLVDDLVVLRGRRRLSVRQLGTASGVPISVITGLENGSAWGVLPTFTTLAAALGRQMVIGEQDVIEAIFDDIARRRASLREVAKHAYLRPNTISELRSTTRAPSMSTVLALTSVLHLHVLLAPTGGDQPRAHLAAPEPTLVSHDALGGGAGPRSSMVQQAAAPVTGG